MDFLTRRDLKYANLIVPLIGCPFGKAIKNCPFAGYWQKYGFEQRINLIHTIPDNKLEELQTYHRNCVLQRKQDANAEPQAFVYDLPK